MLHIEQAGHIRTLAECAFVVCALIAMAEPVHAIRPDECEKQRALYPKNWNDVSSEKALFKCQSHYAGALLITMRAPDGKGRSLMSLVPLEAGGGLKPAAGPDRPVYRIWLDAEQTRRLKKGEYFSTVVRKEQSCWIRGDLSGDPVFFLDNARPATEGGPGESAFYNKAPRISAFKGNAYICETVK